MTFDFNQTNRKIDIIKPFSLYKWNKNYFSLQKKFFSEEFEWIRAKQIEDFVMLNDFKTVWIDNDTDVFSNNSSLPITDKMQDADLLLVLNQNFSRRPCPSIIQEIKNLITECPALYLCLNRHYINIDNSYHDHTLDKNYLKAITQWLKKGLPHCNITDLSFTWDDRGNYFSWSIPDRHYFITRK